MRMAFAGEYRYKCAKEWMGGLGLRFSCFLHNATHSRSVRFSSTGHDPEMKQFLIEIRVFSTPLPLLLRKPPVNLLE